MTLAQVLIILTVFLVVLTGSGALQLVQAWRLQSHHWSFK